MKNFGKNMVESARMKDKKETKSEKQSCDLNTSREVFRFRIENDGSLVFEYNRPNASLYRKRFEALRQRNDSRCWEQKDGDFDFENCPPPPVIEQNIPKASPIVREQGEEWQSPTKKIDDNVAKRVMDAITPSSEAETAKQTDKTSCTLESEPAEATSSCQTTQKKCCSTKTDDNSCFLEENKESE